MNISKNSNDKKNIKTKVYFFNPYPAIGGGDTTIKRFINSLDSNYEIFYLTLKKTVNFNKKIKFINLNKKSTLISFFKIIKIINSHSGKKIFFSMQYFTNIWSIFFLKFFSNTKVFIYEIVHLDEFKYYNNIKDLIKKKIIFFLLKKLYKYSDIIATNSKDLSKDLQKLIFKKVHTIYNPAFFIKKKIKTNKKKIRNLKILNIARFELQKDQMTLIKAINQCVNKKKIILTLIGYGSKNLEIKNFLKKNKIKFKVINKTEKLDKFYQNNHLFVLTSLYEGLPTVMIEAASYGMPIISSNFKSGSSEILCNSKGGFIFKKKDYVALSKILDKFFTHPELFYQKAKFCYKNLEKFSYKKNINKFKKVLKFLSNN